MIGFVTWLSWRRRSTILVDQGGWETEGVGFGSQMLSTPVRRETRVCRSRRMSLERRAAGLALQETRREIRAVFVESARVSFRFLGGVAGILAHGGRPRNGTAVRMEMEGWEG